MKVKSFFKYLALLLFLFSGAQEFYAQTQGRLGSAIRTFNNACVAPNNNGHWRVNFRWSPPYPNPDNKFYIELSDANGNFNNPTVLKVINTKANQSIYEGEKGKTNPELDFSLPTNLNGSNFKIRVRSTNPASELIAPYVGTGGFRKETLEIAWMPIIRPIFVSPQNVTLCPGHTQEIKVVSLPNGEPVGNYRYVWGKMDNGNNRIPIQRNAGPTFTVSEAGTYYAGVEFSGICDNKSYSQNIEVRVSGSQSVNLSSSATEVCESEPFTLTATPANPSAKFIWYRDNTKIAETDGVNTYTVPAGQNLAGNYYVQVGSGGSCDVQSNRVTIKRKDNITASISSDGGTVLMPGKTRVFTVSTTAQSPQYKWFKDGVEITGQTGATYTANAAGTYKAEVTQTAGCAATITTNEITLKAPDSFKVTIKTKTAFQPCTTNAVTLAIDKIAAVAGGSELTVDPSDYSTFSFQWQANLSGTYQDLAGKTQSELSLSSATENGKYKLKVTATGFTIPDSNELDIRLQDSDALKINNGNNSLEFCDGVVTLTVTTGASPSANYTWFKDNVKVAEGVGKTEYAAEGSGVYYATVGSSSGGCPATSNSVVVKKTTITARWAEDINTREIYYHGKTNVLQVSHNMTTPTIEWSKNGAVIPGETGTQLTISSAPTSVDIYTVKLTDNGNCGTVKTLDPVYFETIADITEVKVGTLAISSTDCETRSQTTLEVQKIKVKLSSSGQEVEVKRADYRYFNFQWSKDGNDILGETRHQLVVLRAGNSESAKYGVKVTYNTSIIKTSAERAIAFTPIPDFQISSSDGAKGTVYLCQGGSVTLTVSADSFDPNATLADSFSYKWYKVTSANYTNDTALGSEAPTAKVDAIGEYYLEINNGGCPKRAHIKVENYRLGLFELGFKGSDNNSAVTKIKQYQSPKIKISAQVGEHIVVLKKTNTDDEIEIAGGNFVWVKDDGTEKYGTSLDITSEDMAGSYTLKEISCPAIGENAISFQLDIYKVDVVPNIVTPNGDHFNDTWEIPAKYTSPNVKVTIYTVEGKEEYSGTNYKNQWPSSNSSAFKDLGKRALIYIYTIKGEYTENGETKSVDLKGTITILK